MALAIPFAVARKAKAPRPAAVPSAHGPASVPTLVEELGDSSPISREAWRPASVQTLYRLVQRLRCKERGLKRRAQGSAVTAQPARTRKAKTSKDASTLVPRPFRALARLFLADVSVQRDGKVLLIRIAPREPLPAGPAPVPKAVAEVALSRQALQRLLDKHPLARRAMRHLACFEHLLGSQGVVALNDMPVDVLAQALEQFDAVVTDWSDWHLAELRSRMAVALKERSADAFLGGPGEGLSNFTNASRLMVDDVSHSVFMELERQYKDLVPQETLTAALQAARGDDDQPVTCALTGDGMEPGLAEGAPADDPPEGAVRSDGR